MDNGTVSILNVGTGDTKLTFDKSNPAEVIRAARIVKDMLRHGYALLVETEVDGVKKFTRAYDFDEDTCEYIIADFDPTKEKIDEQTEQAAEGETSPKAEKKRTGVPTKRVAASAAKAVAVGRTAGG